MEGAKVVTPLEYICWCDFFMIIYRIASKAKSVIELEKLISNELRIFPLIDPQSRPTETTVGGHNFFFTDVVRPSVHLSTGISKSKSLLALTLGLIKWIIDDSCIV